MYSIHVSAPTMSELKSNLRQVINSMTLEEVSLPKKHATNIINEINELKPAPVPAAPVSPLAVVPPLITTVPTSVAQASVGETGDRVLDSRGIPWDQRVHSSSKAINKDGTWRVARGKDERVVKEVEDELLLGGKRDAAAQTPVQPLSAPLTPFTAPAAAPQVQEVAAPVVAQPQYENIPKPAGQKPAHSFATFRANLPNVLTQLATDGKIDQPYISQLKEYFHVPNIWDVAKSDNDCKMMFNTFVDAGLITRVD